MKMNVWNGILVNFLACTISLLSYGQRSELIEIAWLAPRTLTQGEESVVVPSIKDQDLNGTRPNFFWRKKIASEQEKLSLEIIETSPALAQEIAYLSQQNISVDELDYELKVAHANTDNYIVLVMFPFVKMNGAIHRINRLEIKRDRIAESSVIPYKDFVSNSVLDDGNGYWYKISVSQDGIHKIDKDFLRSAFEPMGVDVENLDPQHVHIYGNGDGRLPESNALPRTDDLAKNAIEIIGEGDGVFDESDYVLFYAWGPHRLDQKSSTEMTTDRNPYSDLSYYYININSAEPALRIQNAILSASAPTHNVNTYSYHSRHERDSRNLVGGGQRWYGELFDATLSQNFSFSVPDIDASSQVNYEVWLAANAKFGSTNTHSYYVNGTLYATENLPIAGADYLRGSANFSVSSPSSVMTVNMVVNRSSPDIVAYLDYIELNARRNLKMTGSQFNFRDLESVGAANVAEFTLEDLDQSNGFVWDVTDRHTPYLVPGTFLGADYQFTFETDSLREFVASDGMTFLTPTGGETVNPQNLHGLTQADYLIVTHKGFIAEANRLADLHRANGTTVHVVTTEQVFNEFSSGAPDPTAIKMFAKMFYDRGAAAPETRPKHLLLFGDGTYDPKNRVPDNNNFVITYQVHNSENHIQALVTDDYYGLLDDNESINPSDMMDIGVGRLLISSNQMATEQVDKIEHYMRNGSSLYSTANTNCSSDNGSSTFGDWRTKYVQIADDEENGYFIVNDCEPAASYFDGNHGEINVDKIYLDAYQQVTSAGGQRYPDVVDAINDRMERGCLIMNYVGHGGEVGVAEERVITIPQIQDWKNIDKLTLFVSATCEFSKFDDPERVSAGEWVSLNPYGGAIALMTTTRSVFFGVNTSTLARFSEYVFTRDSNDEPLAFGEIMRLTKNAVPSNSNKRSFTLIGDPALKIALPRMNVLTDSINGLNPSVEMDTLRALSKVTIKGHIEDQSGTTMTGFNGVVYPTVYDKPKTNQTLGQDTESPVMSFDLQQSKIYRGKASVSNGFFEFTFVVPKDIDYSIDFGRISYYAENGVIDASGSEERVYIGAIDPNGINDTEGPAIDLYINDDNFVNGGITDESPILIAQLYDENGINTVGNGIGHDLIATLDEETGDPIVLNDYYTSDLDSYQSGEVRYNFSDLETGEHTLSLKAWDVNNNSSEVSIEFIVQEKENLSLEHVLNYPNPFTTYTEFFFEHNQACVDLDVQVQVLTVSGKLVKTINQSIQCDGFRSKGIPWDGLDDFGDQLAKGTYIYRLKVRDPKGGTAEKLEKLVILK